MIDNKNLEAYTKGLQRVKPLLNELSKATRVVWLNAYPVTDESAVPYPEINQLKVQEYNKLTWRTFRYFISVTNVIK